MKNLSYGCPFLKTMFHRYHKSQLPWRMGISLVDHPIQFKSVAFIGSALSGHFSTFSESTCGGASSHLSPLYKCWKTDGLSRGALPEFVGNEDPDCALDGSFRDECLSQQHSAQLAFDVLCREGCRTRYCLLLVTKWCASSRLNRVRSHTPHFTWAPLVPCKLRRPNDGNGRRVVFLTPAVRVPARRVSVSSDLAVAGSSSVFFR